MFINNYREISECLAASPKTLSSAMSTLDKHMLKELLLVCSALGSVETNGIDGNHAEEDEMDDGLAPPSQQRFVRGENCLEWLQDLQRLVTRRLHGLLVRVEGTSIVDSGCDYCQHVVSHRADALK